MTTNTEPGERARAHFEEEASKAEMYGRLAKTEKNPALAEGFRRLAGLEASQADYWRERLPEAQRGKLPDLRLREKTLLTLARTTGARALLPIIAADAQRSVQEYQKEGGAGEALKTEHEVAAEAARLARIMAPSADSLDLARDHRRQTAANGSLRAAVFGINDGLVSNLSLVMGVAGAAPPNDYILLAGLAGLLAGAFSMAGGEYISMLSQRELLERQIEIERQHILSDPAAEQALLAAAYKKRGVPEDHAQDVAEHLMADPARALDAIAREQLGLDPNDLGSPIAAATASFAAFAVGAALAPAPFLFTSGITAVIISAVLCALALIAVGAGVSVFTGRHWLLSGLRMLGVGAAAAIVTFVIGRVIGVAVAG